MISLQEFILFVSVVFFFALGISVFYARPWLSIVYGIAAIFLGVLITIGAITGVIH